MRFREAGFLSMGAVHPYLRSRHSLAKLGLLLILFSAGLTLAADTNCGISGMLGERKTKK